MSLEGGEPLWKTYLDLIPDDRECLIEALRANLIELTKDLGAIYPHFRLMRRKILMDTIQAVEQTHTSRRLLNMILVGQIGYNNGRKHIDGLFKNLKELLAYSDEIVPLHIRKEIAEDYAVIFTGYDHGNYKEMIQECKLEMGNKAFAVELNFDLTLLGNLDLNIYPLIKYEEDQHSGENSRLAHNRKRSIAYKKTKQEKRRMTALQAACGTAAQSEGWRQEDSK